MSPLIILDGPSGSGKDSLLKNLVGKLLNLGVNTYQFSEEELDDRRHEILEARDRGKTGGRSGDAEMAEVLIEHRARIYQQHVEPRLKEGRLVLGNRGEPATLAYQTARGDLTMDAVWQKHRENHIPPPDLVVLTTCEAKTAMQREVSDRQSSVTRGERESGKGLSGKITREINASEAEQLRRRETIHAQYEATRNFLEGKSVPILSLNTERMTVSEEVTTVLKRLEPYLK